MRRASARVPGAETAGAGHRATPLWALAGFVLGATAGWILGELTGSLTRERAARLVPGRRSPSPDPDAPGSPRERVAAAIQADPELRTFDLRVVPAGRTAVELHGWVPSRMLRARATRLAATAAGATRLVDALLVRGEDDRPAADPGSPADTSQSA